MQKLNGKYELLSMVVCYLIYVKYVSWNTVFVSPGLVLEQLDWWGT